MSDCYRISVENKTAGLGNASRRREETMQTMTIGNEIKTGYSLWWYSEAFLAWPEYVKDTINELDCHWHTWLTIWLTHLPVTWWWSGPCYSYCLKCGTRWHKTGTWKMHRLQIKQSSIHSQMCLRSGEHSHGRPVFMMFWPIRPCSGYQVMQS